MSTPLIFKPLRCLIAGTIWVATGHFFEVNPLMNQPCFLYLAFDIHAQQKLGLKSKWAAAALNPKNQPVVLHDVHPCPFIWLVPYLSGWWFGTFGLLFHIYIFGISSSQLPNSIIFQRGWNHHQPVKRLVQQPNEIPKNTNKSPEHEMPGGRFTVHIPFIRSKKRWINYKEIWDLTWSKYIQVWCNHILTIY